MGKEPQCLKPSVVSQHAVPSRCMSAAFPCPPVSSVHEQNKSLMVLVAFLALSLGASTGLSIPIVTLLKHSRILLGWPPRCSFERWNVATNEPFHFFLPPLCLRQEALWLHICTLIESWRCTVSFIGNKLINIKNVMEETWPVTILPSYPFPMSPLRHAPVTSGSKNGYQKRGKRRVGEMLGDFFPAQHLDLPRGISPQLQPWRLT